MKHRWWHWLVGYEQHWHHGQRRCRACRRFRDMDTGEWIEEHTDD